MGIQVQNLQDRIECPPELLEMLEGVVEQVFIAEGLPPEMEVAIVLVDDEHIRRYSAQYRGVDRPTDVLSFPQLEPGEDFGPEEEEHPLGDIMISLERAHLQAKDFGHSLAREVAYLAVHGMYHLLGYDHDTPTNRERMREKEERILSSLGLGREE